jgi:hypothetical protein
MLEPTFLELGRGQPDKALPAAEASLRQWAVLRPALEKEITSPANQLALVDGAVAGTVLTSIYHKLGDTEAEVLTSQQTVADSKRLLDLMPDNPHFRSLRVDSLMQASHALKTPRDQQLQYYEEADHLVRQLLANDPTNLRWRIDSVAIAKELSGLAAQVHDGAAQRRWVDLTADRLTPIYQTHSTNLKYLIARGAYANFCGNYYRTQDWEINQDSGRLHESEEWKQGVFHLHEAARTLQIIYQIDPTDKNRETLESYAKDAAEKIKAASGQEAADKWLAEFKLKPKS